MDLIVLIAPDKFFLLGASSEERSRLVPAARLAAVTLLCGPCSSPQRLQIQTCLVRV